MGSLVLYMVQWVAAAICLINYWHPEDNETAINDALRRMKKSGISSLSLKRSSRRFLTAKQKGLAFCTDEEALTINSVSRRNTGFDQGMTESRMRSAETDISSV